MNYMLNGARYPDWETEARLRAVKPAWAGSALSGRKDGTAKVPF